MPRICVLRSECVNEAADTVLPSHSTPCRVHDRLRNRLWGGEIVASVAVVEEVFRPFSKVKRVTEVKVS